ncbi:MAG: hypothetical protein H0W50_08555 [Parachlamydiaceae bacterium]|nr:hypothetical protein [Parachlamydiaceae bacterium]
MDANHSYNYSALYNFFFHLFHNRNGEENGSPLITNIFIAMLTKKLWLAPLVFFNLVDMHQLVKLKNTESNPCKTVKKTDQQKGVISGKILKITPAENLISSHITQIQNSLDNAKLNYGDNEIAFKEALNEIKRLSLDSSFSKDIFRAMDANQLFELTKLYAQNFDDCAKIIEKFGISDQNYLFEIAKLSFGKNFNGTIFNIKKFGITDQNKLFELIEICCEKNISQLIFNIREFGITDQNQLFNIAKLCCKKNISITCFNILEFGDLDQNQLFEIAKICLKTNALEASKKISLLSLKNQIHLVELLKIFLIYDKNEKVYFDDIIADFQILEPNQIFEIVKCSSQKIIFNPRHFHRYRITDPIQVYEIAGLCAQNDGRSTARFIKNFGIKDQLKLVEIATICAQHSTYNIENFGITDQVELIVIAKKSARCAQNIDKFGITDRNQLFEIAKLSAQKNGTLTAENIRKFGITDNVQLFELAQMCSEESQNIIKSINNFDLTFDQSIFIFKYCMRKVDASDYISNFHLFFKNKYYFENELKYSSIMLMVRKEFKMLQELFILVEMYPDEIVNFDFNQCADILRNYSIEKFVGNPFEKALENIMNIPDAFGKYQNLLWLANTMVIFNTSKVLEQISDDQIPSLNDREIFESIASFGKPKLRLPLSLIVLSLASMENGLEIFKKLHSVQQNSNKGQAHFQNLLFLFFATLVSRGVDVNSEVFSDEGTFRKEILKKSSCFFKKENSQIMIEMLLLLVQNKTLSVKVNEGLLVRVISETPLAMEKFSMTNDELQSSYLRNAQSLVSIFEFNEVSRLSDTSKNLVEISEEILREKLSCVDVENFTSKYHQTFRENRNPSAIVTYAAKINSLNDPDATECLGRYVASTLEGPSAFRIMRYDLTNNPHLTKINEFDPKLFEDWKNNLDPINIDELKYDENSSSNTQPTAKDWMKQKLITDKHLDMETLDVIYLNNYLQETDLQKRREIEIMLLDAHSISLKNLKEINKTKESRIIMSLKNCNNQIKSIDSKILKDSIKINLGRLNEQKNTLQLKFDKNLTLLVTKFPILSQRVIKGNNYDEIIKFIEGCNEIQTFTWMAKENISKRRLEILCIKWIKGIDSLQASNTEMNNNQIKSSEDKLKKILVEILKILNASPFSSPEFANDIQNKINEKSVSMAIGNSLVVETDDPIDILLCGTEVDGSCQRIDGDAHLNKGLLGYNMDGKIKILAIKNAEGAHGKIKARCLLRMLWDGDKPVLFMERLYPSNITSKQAQALIYMARKKAEILGVPLLTLGGSGEDYGKPLIALGGSSPWEYCDGAMGMTKGKYEIKDARSVG